MLIFHLCVLLIVFLRKKEKSLTMSKVDRTKQRIGSSKVKDFVFASSSILPAKLPARVAGDMLDTTNI